MQEIRALSIVSLFSEHMGILINMTKSTCCTLKARQAFSVYKEIFSNQQMNENYYFTDLSINALCCVVKLSVQNKIFQDCNSDFHA